MILISLSGKKQSGKSTVANYLTSRHGYTELSFAYPLKEIIGKQLFGLDDNQLYGNGAVKEQKIPQWGRSPREILQIVGTDLFRKNFDPDFWVKIMMKKIRDIRSKDSKARIVISDCRFPNEAYAVQSLGGYCIHIEKQHQVNNDEHESERALDHFKFDSVFSVPAGDLDSLYRLVDNYLNDLKGESDAV